MERTNTVIPRSRALLKRVKDVVNEFLQVLGVGLTVIQLIPKRLTIYILPTVVIMERGSYVLVLSYFYV
jgi:hypothetical protein